MKHYIIYSLVPAVFWCSLQDFLSIRSRHTQSVRHLQLSVKRQFTSSFLIWMAFISGLIVMAKNSVCAMLNRTSESRRSCLVFDLRGKATNLSLLTMMLAMESSYVAFIMFSYFPPISDLLRVFLLEDVEFCQMLFLYLLRWSYNLKFFICFPPVLLRYNWYLALYKFKVHSIMTWLI